MVQFNTKMISGKTFVCVYIVLLSFWQWLVGVNKTQVFQ